MPALSQNGYTANDRNLIATYTVPGTTVRLPLRKGDVATVLLYVAKRYNTEVETLRDGWCWGYAERNIRGSATTLSNHASGTAVDFNAPVHPLGSPANRSFSIKQLEACHKIVDDCKGVVRWGGTYFGRPDSMHWEIVGSEAEVKGLAQRIKNLGKVVIRRNLKKGVKGNDVLAVQKRLVALGFNPGTPDGIYGDKTGAAVKAFKKSRHWNPLFLNTICGNGTVRALGGNLAWGG